MDYTEKRIRTINQIGEEEDCYIAHFNNSVITVKSMKDNRIIFCADHNGKIKFEEIKRVLIEMIDDELIDLLGLLVKADGMNEMELMRQRSYAQSLYVCGHSNGENQSTLQAKCEKFN